MGACTMYFVFNTMINKDTEFPYILCAFVIHIFCLFFPSKQNGTPSGTWFSSHLCCAPIVVQFSRHEPRFFLQNYMRVYVILHAPKYLAMDLLEVLLKKMVYVVHARILWCGMHLLKITHLHVTYLPFFSAILSEHFVVKRKFHLKTSFIGWTEVRNMCC
jgi:hypothetical protein